MDNGSKSYRFIPEVQKLGEFNPVATVAEIAEEVGMFSCSPEFVRANGGPLTLSMLDAIPERFYKEAEAKGLYPNIDVRVHRLYPGDYPAVPGWHCDGEFRENWYSQPDLDRVVPHSHIVGTMSTEEGGVSLTEFVSQEYTATVDENSEEGVWQQVHRQIESDRPETVFAQDGVMHSMSSFTLHRCTPARVRGWRLFVRASMWHKPYLNDGGILARQEYVYRVDESKGW